MSLRDYRRIIDQISPYALHLTLYFQGEPLLHPSFPDFIRYAREKGLYTATSTNGQLLDETKAAELVEAGLDHLIVSVDGATQRTYEKYRTGGKLQLALDGIRHIVEARDRRSVRHPVVEMQTLVFAHNENELSEIRRMGKQLNIDRFTLKTAQIYDYRHGSPLMPVSRSHSRYVRQDDGTYRLKRGLPNRCRRMFCGAVIDWQGNVLPCAFDKDAEHRFGNLLQEDLRTIWYGARAQAFRRRILTHRTSCAMCCNCVY